MNGETLAAAPACVADSPRTPGAAPTFDAASLECASRLAVRTIDTSRNAGWSSLLLEHHQLLTTEHECETLPTSHQTIVVMTRGEQDIEVYGRGRWRRAVYRPGTIGLTPGGMTDRLRRQGRASAGPACKLNLYVSRRLIEEAVDHLGRSAAARARATVALDGADGALEMAARTLLRALRAGAPSLYADSLAHWLSIHMLTSFGRSADTAYARVRTGGIRDKRLTSVLEYIEQHLSEDVTLDRLAREAAVSKFHFSRLFRQATGSTPHRWLTERRISAAKTLLETTDLSIAEVASKSGFKRSNFASSFQRELGMTPGDYRLGV